MAIRFDNEPLRWDKEDIQPSESLKKNGWKSGDKPPAQYFNAKWNTDYKVQKELQTKLLHMENNVTSGIQLSEDDDLNDVTTPGLYYSPENVSGMLNTPNFPDLQFSLSVVFTAEGNIVQILIDRDGNIHMRNYLNSWGNWCYMLDSSKVIDSVIANSNYPVSSAALYTKFSEKAEAEHTHPQSDISGLTDTLSGLENDISSKANTTHTHQASDITGAIPVSKGGTGATNASNARKNLGLKAAATYDISSDVVKDSSKLATSEALYNAVRASVQLESSTNLDTIDMQGTYYGDSAVNGPVSNEHYALKVFGGSATNSNDIIVQEYYSQSGVYYRVSGNGVAAYGSWVKIGG